MIMMCNAFIICCSIMMDIGLYTLDMSLEYYDYDVLRFDVCCNSVHVCQKVCSLSQILVNFVLKHFRLYNFNLYFTISNYIIRKCQHITTSSLRNWSNEGI